MDEKLKECPCCGGMAELEYDPPGAATDEGLACVQCMKCGLRTKTEYWTEVASLWNRRVPVVAPTRSE